MINDIISIVANRFSKFKCVDVSIFKRAVVVRSNTFYIMSVYFHSESMEVAFDQTVKSVEVDTTFDVKYIINYAELDVDLFVGSMFCKVFYD